MARDWLRIYGCDAVIVSGPASQEQFKPYAYPRKFDGVLPVLWRESDVTIYAVPRRSRALATWCAAPIWRRVSPRRQPASGVTAFLAALEDPGLPQPLSNGWEPATRAWPPIFDPVTSSPFRSPIIEAGAPASTDRRGACGAILLD